MYHRQQVLENSRDREMVESALLCHFGLGGESIVDATALPIHCIRRLMERKEVRKDLPYDRHLTIELSPGVQNCREVIEDIVLRGEFRLGERLYLIKKITRGQDDGYRLFAMGSQPDHACLTIEAIGLK